MWKSIAIAAVAGAFVVSQPVFAAEKSAEKPSAALGFKVQSLDGKDVDLGKYQGKVVLIVNVASKCGLTPQYSELEALYKKYADRGFVILGFPCNQFHSQEPGTADEIRKFCTAKYNVTFPLMAKVEVNGDGACDLYKYLKSLDAEAQGPRRGDVELREVPRRPRRQGRRPLPAPHRAQRAGGRQGHREGAGEEVRLALLVQLPIPPPGPQPIQGNVPLAAAYLKLFARRSGLQGWTIEILPGPALQRAGRSGACGRDPRARTADCRLHLLSLEHPADDLDRAGIEGRAARSAHPLGRPGNHRR